MRTNASLARRCRRRHLWTAVIEKTILSRERLLEYMPPRMLHDRCEVLELSVLIPAELPVSCDLLCDVTLIESMPGLPICPWTPASTVRKVLREPQTCSDALPAVCAPSIGLIAEGRASRQADLQRLAAMVHKSTLAAMPYEIVEPPPGTEAYCRHRIDMEAEIRHAPCCSATRSYHSFLGDGGQSCRRRYGCCSSRETRDWFGTAAKVADDVI